MLNKGLWYSFIFITTAGMLILGIGFYQALQTTLEARSLQSTAALAGPASASGNPGNGVSPSQGRLSSGSTASPGGPGSPASQRSQESETNLGSSGSSLISPKGPNAVKVFILGDSIAKGTGDETGKGFSGYLPNILKSATAKDIIIENAGVDGLESTGLVEQLQNKKLIQSLADADLILISIGGNDVRRILSINPIQKEEAFKTRQEAYISRLKTVLQDIRKANPNAALVFLGLYNPYEKPEAPEDIRYLNTWNYASQQLVEADSKGIFIPSRDLMKYNLSKYLAPDGMHPNGAGYLALAQRIGQSVAAVLPQ